MTLTKQSRFTRSIVQLLSRWYIHIGIRAMFPPAVGDLDTVPDITYLENSVDTRVNQDTILAGCWFGLCVNGIVFAHFKTILCCLFQV